MTPTPSRYSLPQRENEWIHHMLEYNTKGGKMTRGLMVVETASIIFKARYTPFRAASLYHAASLFHAASLYHAACRYPPPSSSRRAAILTMAIPTYGLLPTDYFLLPTSYLTTDYLHFTTFQLTTDRLLFTTCYFLLCTDDHLEGAWPAHRQRCHVQVRRPRLVHRVAASVAARGGRHHG